ncbi:MAG: hypothetical protein EOP84_13170 [Verrucomicrobiaceae bacterium]|nr:MAG: hypothetical protein EOP84_13170 [Verrucomicrobiaceae bacterium]
MEEFLKELSEALKAFGFSVQVGENGGYPMLWVLGLTNFPSYYDGENEHPELAFAMLDVLESNGQRPFVGLLPEHEKEPGFAKSDRVYRCSSTVFTYGSTRTEAIARNVVARHKAGLLSQKGDEA